jgi:phage major head subunit gpT-like protein
MKEMAIYYRKERRWHQFLAEKPFDNESCWRKNSYRFGFKAHDMAGIGGFRCVQFGPYG